MGCAASSAADPEMNAVLELGKGEKSWGHAVTSNLGRHEGALFGVHVQPSKKNQDGFGHSYLPRCGARTLGAYAVFDGHGTSTAAMELARANLLALILPADASVPVLPNDLVRAFEQTSLKIINAGVARTGTTATVVLIAGSLKDPTRGARYTVTCAWVGDSRCCLVTPKGKVLRLSVDHHVSNNSERVRIEADSIEQAAVTGLERSTFIARRANENGEEGPWALFNAQPNSYTIDEDELSDELQQLSGAGLLDLSVRGRKRATSTLVTRALGDAHGSESLSATPEIITVQNVKPGSRIIMGSDGLWDVFANDKAAAFIKGITDPRKAAAGLAKEAQQRRLYGGLSKDDITVFVVNVEQPRPSMEDSSRKGTTSTSIASSTSSTSIGLASLRSEVNKTVAEVETSGAARAFESSSSFDYSRGSFVIENVDTPTLSKWKQRAQNSAKPELRFAIREESAEQSQEDDTEKGQ
jgi:serine/threonine protein phosphatase PrpC